MIILPSTDTVLRLHGAVASSFGQRFRAGVGLAALCVLGFPGPVAAASPAFVQKSFVEAQALAAKEGKVVFVDFFTTWCPPCKRLDAVTWQDANVITLLQEKTVALKIDAEKERDLAKKYRVDAYPTLLVIKPDGTEMDRYVGFMDPVAFREALTATLAGKTSLQVARETVQEKDRPSPREQMALARKLAEAGKHEEALAAYLWCYDSGPDLDPAFARTGPTMVPPAIAALGRKYPPALDALRTRRDALQAKVLVDPAAADVATAGRLAALDVALKDDAAMVMMLGKLPDGGARKAYGGNPVLTRLVEKKRYREALSLGSPEEEYARFSGQSTRMAELMKKNGRQDAETLVANLAKGSATIGTIYVVALAGAGEKDRARKLSAAVLANASNDPEIRRLLREGLVESGFADLADELVPEAKPDAPVSASTR